MQVWREEMPRGMHLKSDGFASDLYDPDRRFTLKNYCKDHRIAYADYGLPVNLGTFVDYALDFQKQCVPMLERVRVVDISRSGGGFTICLENGETLTARSVVMATGISYFSYVPECLSSLPRELCTHSGAHHDLSGFRNRRVVVVGGGASATDLAALMHKEGASVRVVSRSRLEFHLPPDDKPRSLWKRLRAPNLGLGPSLRSALYTVAPWMFHFLPRELRLRLVRRHLGPAGGWFIKDQVIGKVQLHVGEIKSVSIPTPQRIALQLTDEHGSPLEIEADHVIAATGYQVSVASLGILNKELRIELQTEDKSPILSLGFQSSISGLYFIGVASANSFGPVMRFARGAEYAAVRLSAHLGRVYTKLKVERSVRTASA